MALIKCKECGQQISKKARECPNCGASRPRQISWTSSLIIIALFIWFLVSTHKNDYETIASPNQTPTSWQYANYFDDMSNKEIKKAYISSQNEVIFGFPYNQQQRATLTIRKHPRYGSDVILSIEKGQFLCRLQGCGVNVRFGSGNAELFSANEPSDHSSTTIFISNYGRFVSKLKKADSIKLEAEFYQDGTRVFEFKTAGLQWE